MADELRGWKPGDAYCGTAQEAIDYVLDANYDEGFGLSDRMEFLERWREGDLSEYPEFRFKPQT